MIVASGYGYSWLTGFEQSGTFTVTAKKCRFIPQEFVKNKMEPKEE